MEYFIKTKEHFLMCLDTEFDNQNLVQLGIILLEKKEENKYSLVGSLNMFVETELSFYFRNNHIITQDFLDEEAFCKERVGNELTKFMESVYEVSEDILVIGHGISQDLSVIFNSINVDLRHLKRYDTYSIAKKYNLPNLKLKGVALESGYVPSVEHDAFDDAKTTLAAFTYLKELENEST